MGPFNTTVFRIRLLLLAALIGLMGVGGDPKAPQMAESVKPIKVKEPQRKAPPSGNIVAVKRQQAPAPR